MKAFTNNYQYNYWIEVNSCHKLVEISVLYKKSTFMHFAENLGNSSSCLGLGEWGSKGKRR